MRGTIKWFREDKGYGFITPQDGGKDVFVHASSLLQGQRSLPDGCTVEFEITPGRKGDQASNVKIVA